MPPKKIKVFECKNTYEENGKVFSKFTRILLALAGTQRGVWNYLASAGKTGGIPFLYGRKRFDLAFQNLFLLIHPHSGDREWQIQRSDCSLPNLRFVIYKRKRSALSWKCSCRVIYFAGAPGNARSRLVYQLINNPACEYCQWLATGPAAFHSAGIFGKFWPSRRSKQTMGTFRDIRENGFPIGRIAGAIVRTASIGSTARPL